MERIPGISFRACAVGIRAQNIWEVGVQGAPEDETDAPAEQSSLETELDESIAAPRIESPEIDGSGPTINGKVVKIGSTGTYQTSKKRTSNVKVVNILNFQEGNPEFQIAIVIGNAYQRIIKSTDPKFTLD